MALRTLTGVLPGTGKIEVDIEDGIIVAVRRQSGPFAMPAEGTLDLLLPGLVDLQVNGIAGIDLNGGELRPDDVVAIVNRLATVGVTSFCPTIITAAADSMLAALAAIGEAMAGDPVVEAAVLGVHLEGPWISPADGPRGAHPAAHVRAASIEELDAFLHAGAPVSIITLAPEVPAAIELTRAAARAGVVVAIGHSAADPDAIRAAADAGARLSTHLGNGAAAMLPRHPNLIWAQLGDDRLFASFIADGHHVDPATLATMVRAKRANRTILVSDATAHCGMPPGLYTTAIGGEVELDEDGRLGMVGTPYLAGAARPLIDGLALVLSREIMNPDDAVAAVTSRPATLVGARARGVIVPGARADLVAARWSGDTGRIAVLETVAGGRVAEGMS
jgi:N-acetylglucosamine-6-phosphate deacetylase